MEKKNDKRVEYVADKVDRFDRAQLNSGVVRLTERVLAIAKSIRRTRDFYRKWYKKRYNYEDDFPEFSIFIDNFIKSKELTSLDLLLNCYRGIRVNWKHYACREMLEEILKESNIEIPDELKLSGEQKLYPSLFDRIHDNGNFCCYTPEEIKLKDLLEDLNKKYDNLSSKHSKHQWYQENLEELLKKHNIEIPDDVKQWKSKD